jgi:hypothetical protein
MAEAKKQPNGRFRRWLGKRRDAQRRGAEMAERATATRKADADKAMRRGNVGSGHPGPFGGP